MICCEQIGAGLTCCEKIRVRRCEKVGVNIMCRMKVGMIMMGRKKIDVL
jgi:hypothetical protein